MEEIVIFGAGGFGREVKSLIETINSENKNFNFIGFYDDGFSTIEKIENYPILGGIEGYRKIK